ncbi:RNase P subunit p30 family protein [Haloplanus sp. C73]|uniref:RNase P subunit p30 family protein n=1 Tax=Haloplanus sp. C73 TaxID=3421641 RepID=UPI003EBBA7CA
MYEAVHAHPDGASTAARLVDTAARVGYEGVVIRGETASPDHAALRDSAGIDVVDAVEIVAPDPERASGAVGGERPDHTLICVRGGTDRLNRFAVENDRVDVLTRPMDGEGDVNHVLAKRAADNGVRIEFDFGPVLRSTGGERVRALRNLRKLRELVADADAPYVVSATPDSHLDLRAPRELVAVGEVIGFDAETVRTGLREWGALAERNRHRQSDSFVSPGVERGRYEESQDS